MRSSKSIAILLLLILEAFALTQPVLSAASVHSKIVPVNNILPIFGTAEGSINALETLDQSGSDDETSKYVRFSGMDVPYSGIMVFTLPGSVQTDRVTSTLLQINFNGPSPSQQLWIWSIQDPVTEIWHDIGNSLGARPGEWSTLLFRVPTLSRYVFPNHQIHIRLESDAKGNTARMDYEALHITYIPVIPSATRPTSTMRVTKAGYIFPITFTPSFTPTFTHTFTPTDTFTPTNTATATATPACAAHDSNFECQVLFLINQERASRSIPPLISNSLLHTAARNHSTDMAQHNFFSHTGSNGSDPGDRITSAGYSWSTWGENIAAGQATPTSVVNAWMNSEGHRNNILNPNFVHIGIGYAYNSASTYDHYWTTDFGKP